MEMFSSEMSKFEELTIAVGKVGERRF